MSERMKASDLRPVRYMDGKLIILDQTLLPGKEEYIELKTLEEVIDAIKKLKVRGAPAIGVAAAFGVIVALKEKRLAEEATGQEDVKGGDLRGGHQGFEEDSLWESLNRIVDQIGSARPTAVNLSKAVERMRRKGEAALMETGDSKDREVSRDRGDAATYENLISDLEDEARKIQKEDEEANLAMGEFGLSLIKPGMGVLTHCNAGALATSCYGTALSPIYLANERGYDIKVFADETRPLLQGARLTAWELDRAGVDVTLICDNMAQTVMRKGWVDAVFVGCDRMAANGDGANKIGTAALAILAKEFGIPFYMVVPTSTIDLGTATGEDIEIELRSDDEIKEMWYNTPMAPKGVKTFNPAFDVTPNEYITAVVTEKGIVRPPFDVGLREIMEKR